MTDQNAPPRFTQYPLLWLALSFACGINAAYIFPIDWKISSAICLATATFALFFLNRNFSTLFLMFAFAFAGNALYQIETSNIAENRIRRILDEGRITSGEPVEIEGIVTGNPEPSAEGVFLRVQTEKIFHKNVVQETSGILRLFVPVQGEEAVRDYKDLAIRHGSQIRIACEPERDERYLNPGTLSRKQMLDQQGIDATATVKSPLLIEKFGQVEGWFSLSFIYDVRQYLISKFEEKFSTSTSGVMIASLLGDKYFLDKPTADVFREGGTFHILVISGLHITFIGGLTVLFVGIFTNRKGVQFLVAVVFLWAYTLAVGAEVPVVRASLMFTILTFSYVIHRQGTLLNALGACGLILLVWRPQDLFNPSFQLTFVSVAAIVVTAFPVIEKLRETGRWTPNTQTPFPPNVPAWLKSFCEMLYWRSDVWKIESDRQIWSAKLFKSPYLKWLEARNLQGIAAFIFEGVLVSLIVQFWLLPLQIVYFHRVSFAAVFLNIWVGVVIAIESFCAVFAVFIAIFSDVLATPVVQLTEVLNWLLVSVPAIFVESDLAGVRLPVYSGWAKGLYFVYFAAIAALGYSVYTWEPFSLKRQSHRRNIAYSGGIGTLILAVIFVFHPFSPPAADGKLHFDFLDVGQGDSIFITFPDGQTMLVDGGGRINFGGSAEGEDVFVPDVPRVGEMVVSEFLWEKGYSSVDFIVGTHADVDHMQGLVDVVRNFKVKTAMLGRTPENDEEFAELAAALTRRRVPIMKIRRGASFEIGGVQVDVLFPAAEITSDDVSDNDHSVVLRITFGEKVFLLTGDAERQAEIELIRSSRLLKANVVKVPHHGSRTSSMEAFVEAVKPDVAVISVGKKSMFGHPHVEVVERWKAIGAKVMTTGEKGAITISTDGKNLDISTFIP